MTLPDRFDHNFASCSRTYVTLCIYHDTADPQTISAVLKLEPDRSHKVGDLIRANKRAPASGWFLGTQNILQSRDFMAHVEWLLDKLRSKENELQELCNSGYRMRLSCFWESANGNGGPFLDHEFIKRLSEFTLDLDFDVYFGCQDET